MPTYRAAQVPNHSAISTVSNRFDIGSSSTLWDVGKEFNVGGARDKDVGNISPDRDSNEAASIWGYWIRVYG
jgi:hypothetical protein